MECHYSNPIVFNCNNSGSMKCVLWETQTCSYNQASPSAVNVVNYPEVASMSGTTYIDVATTSALAQGLQNKAHLDWLSFGLFLLVLSFFIGVRHYTTR